MEIIVGQKYKLKKRVGAGSFGEIYAGEDVETHRDVAIKLEQIKTRSPQLIYESKLYMLFAGGVNVPQVHWAGPEHDFNVMVIDLLGKSLEDLFQECSNKFSLKTVLMLADQMLTSLEYIHKKSFIHRDIKPDNFMMGPPSNPSQVYIIDFGLSKKYRDIRTHQHIPFSDHKSLTGTARYASVNALKGVEQSRRDDMESLGYVWMYLLRGSLPWQGLSAKDQKQKYERICQKKEETPFEELCADFPIEFVNYFYMVRSLEFDQEPEYYRYRTMFRDLFRRLGYTYDYQYDWVTTKKPSGIPRQVKQVQRRLEAKPREVKARPSPAVRTTRGVASTGATQKKMTTIRRAPMPSYMQKPRARPKY